MQQVVAQLLDDTGMCGPVRWAERRSSCPIGRTVGAGRRAHDLHLVFLSSCPIHSEHTATGVTVCYSLPLDKTVIEGQHGVRILS